MTRFERDRQEALAGNERAVITRRRRELEELIKLGKSCKNSFRSLCIAQDVVRLERELNEIIELF